jgi:hypothetical protein
MGAEYSSYLIPKSYNTDDIIQTGTFFVDIDENIFLKKIQKLLRNLKSKNYPFTKINKIEQLNMTDEEYYNLVNNFISYYNKIYSLQIKFLKESFYQKDKINNKHFRYIITFFIEFEYRHWVKAYHMAFVLLTDDDKKYNINLKNNLVKVDLLGAWSTSDIKFGSKNIYMKGLNNYLDKLKEDDFQKYSRVIANTYEISRDLRTKEYIYDDNYQIARPPYKFKEEKLLYVKPNENIPVKIKINNKCISYDKNKINVIDCNKTNTRWNFLNTLKIQHSENKKCLSFHRNNDLSLVDCESISNCNKDGNLNSCQKFKTIKYGGLQLVNNGDCLNINSNSVIHTDKCNRSSQIKFFKKNT